MAAYEVFKDLAIIILAAKLFGIFARKLKAPQVVGEIIAGLVVGPCILGLVQTSDFLAQMAEIGVIMIMFSAGLDTDLKELLKTGPVAFFIACMGVFVPLVSGAAFYSLVYGASPWGSEGFYRAVFIGCIMTATSVSITVEALKEMGVLKGHVGTTILSAAIIDDVIGIIVLTFVIGAKDPTSNPITVIIKTILFFIFAIIVGFGAYFIFKFIDKRYEHKRRIPILSLAFCFAMAYCSEKLFGVADITGAYAAGIILCSIKDSKYIENKIDINAYMIFGPVFFASIGIKTDISDINPTILWFSLGFVLIALVAKIIGCGLAAKICKFNFPDSLKIGLGMMTRGEVALIVSQKGLNAGLMDSVYFTAVILLIITSSVVTPLLLKAVYSKWPDKTLSKNA